MQVLRELVGDKSLEKFRVEYEKLHRTLKKSHESEKRLIKKCRELNNEIVANAAKVQTALKLSEEDQSIIAALKKEIEKAWKMVDASHEKEAKAKENIQELKLEIANLSRLVEQGTGVGGGQESALMDDLMRQKDELVAERDGQVQQIVALRNEVMESGEKLRAAEAARHALETDIAALTEEVNGKKAEGEREMRHKERLEREMRDLKRQLDERAVEVKAKQTTVQAAQEQVKRLEKQLHDQHGATERAQRESDGLTQKVQKLHADLDEQTQHNTQLLTENSQRKAELKSKEDELATVRGEIARVNKIRDNALAKVKQVERQRTEVERQAEEYRGEIAQLEREIDAGRRAVDTERKKQDELMRERDILNKLKTSAENATSRQMDLVKVNENTRKNLEQEISGYKAEAQRQGQIINSLEREREKYGAEVSNASAKYLQALEEVKMRKMTIIDLQKKIVEGESKLRQQQNLYEAVRSDRNLYSKNLIEAQDEIQEMKRKFKMMSHQIEQLKEEIGSKDLALVKEHFDHVRVEKEKESLRFELQKAREQIKEAESAISAQSKEIEKLNQIISEADQERLRQTKEYDTVINERDILGTQLIRRNDELALLYEKIKIQASTLSKGQIQYRDRLNEIRVLKIKLSDVKRELLVVKNSVAAVDVLKREVHHLGRELLQERTKVKALSEELENPLNVHRWRKLEGSDPGLYDMILKIQTLQKRLIAKTEEVVERDLAIQEKERLYVELKSILARQPGPEVAEQLTIYQASLREKTRSMKSMASELNMYSAQCAEYKYEIERLNRELAALKAKWYESKRREQQAEHKATAKSTSVKTQPLGASQARFTGGGFSLND